MQPVVCSQISYWTIISGPYSLLEFTWKFCGEKQTGTGVNHGLWRYTVGAETESIKQHGELHFLRFQETRGSWLLNCSISETSQRRDLLHRDGAPKLSQTFSTCWEGNSSGFLSLQQEYGDIWECRTAKVIMLQHGFPYMCSWKTSLFLVSLEKAFLE